VSINESARRTSMLVRYVNGQNKAAVSELFQMRVARANNFTTA